MPVQEERERDASDPSDIAEETQRLMGDAMRNDISVNSPNEIPVTTAAESIDETNQRIQARIEDLLSSIEDSVRLVEPELIEKLEATLERLKPEDADESDATSSDDNADE